MNLIRFKPVLDEAAAGLQLRSDYVSDAKTAMYRLSGLNKLRSTIEKLLEVPALAPEVYHLKDSWLFKNYLDVLEVVNSEDTTIKELVSRLKIKIEVLMYLINSQIKANPEILISVEIPEIQGFDTLEKYANDLKKVIEIPITDEAIGGSVEIVSADGGSIVLYIIVGSIAAVKLVAGICWAAAVIRKKNAEAKIIEAGAKSLDLNNNVMKEIADGIIKQHKQLINDEAEALAAKYYSTAEPEAVERLKLSINIFSVLMDKGIKILPLPSKNEPEIKFPDYNLLNTIQSDIKQINDDK
ncbi:MAG: hypothetical protein H7122_05650 [Chitinophagaceae bacterium]|nr:hypothetical protein [Chitinophagaceae bacterium]